MLFYASTITACDECIMKKHKIIFAVRLKRSESWNLGLFQFYVNIHVLHNVQLSISLLVLLDPSYLDFGALTNQLSQTKREKSIHCAVNLFPTIFD